MAGAGDLRLAAGAGRDQPSAHHVAPLPLVASHSVTRAARPTPLARPTRVTEAAAPVAVGVLALLLRILHLRFGAKLLLADDAEFFEQHARQFLDAWNAAGTRDWWPLLRTAIDESSLQGVLYPFFQSLVYWTVGGVHHGALAAIQAALGALTVVFTYLAGRRAFGPLAGALAGLFAAVYPPLIASTGQLLAESVLTFVQSAALYTVVRGLEPGAWRARLLGGICVGLLMLRPAFQYSGALLLVALVASAAWSAEGRQAAPVSGDSPAPQTHRSHPPDGSPRYSRETRAFVLRRSSFVVRLIAPYAA